MSLTRSRTAVRKRADEDMVDLDSEEFEEAIAAADDAAPKRSKRQRGSAISEAAVVPQRRTKSAENDEATAILLSSDNEYVASEDEDLDELQELEERPATAQSASEQDSEIDEDSASDSAGSDVRPSVSGKQQDKQQKGKAAGKKPRKKRESTKRLCASWAKAQFHLTDRDLSELTDIQYRDNPHHPNAAPMKLYLVRELQELAHKKVERIEALAATAEERALERAEAARQARIAAAEAAAATLRAAGSKALRPADEKHGSVQLPDTCLARITACIANMLEPGGLRGPSAVAKELYNVSLVCWDFYHAAKAGFISLAEATSTLQQQAPASHPYVKGRSSEAMKIKVLHGMYNLPGDAKLGGWPFWDKVLRDPTNFKLPELKDAAKHLRLQVTGTKAELVLRILSAFGFPAPTTAPSQLVRALVLERSCLHPMIPIISLGSCLWDGPDHGEQIQIAVSRLKMIRHASVEDIYQASYKGAAGVRALLLKSFRDVSHLTATTGTALAEYRRKEAEDRKRLIEQRAAAEADRMAARQAALAAGTPLGTGIQRSGGICACGNNAAQACTRGCCGVCCHRLARSQPGTICTRHKT